MILHINIIRLATMETMLMNHLISLQETINEQDEKITILIEENVKLQIIVVENESLKKMVAKLENKIRECKKE